MVADEQVQPGRVAATDFHTVDGRECLMHREDGVDSSAVDITATEVRHHRRGPEPVTFDVPRRIADAD